MITPAGHGHYRVDYQHNARFFFLHRFEEMSESFLEKIRSTRAKESISPEQMVPHSVKHHEARDIYALGALSSHVLSDLTDEGTMM